MNEQTKIMFMCGGRGSRLRTLTEQVPKPLVPFHGSTIFHYKVNDYLQQGFDSFIVCVGYKGDLIRNAASQFNSTSSFEFSDEGEDAGILQRAFAARDLFDDYVVITYGDTYADIDINKLVEQHRNSDNEATIVTAPIKSPFGLVEFDYENKVKTFREKPTLNYYIGQAVVNKSAFDYASPQVISMPDGSGIVAFFKILMALDKLGTYHHTGLDITFNTPEEHQNAERDFMHFFTYNE